MGEYTSYTYAVKYISDNTVETVSCGNNKKQAELFCLLLNKAGIKAEVVTRTLTAPDWPAAEFEDDTWNF